MSKGFWGVIVAIILIFVGVAALSGNSGEDTGGKGSSKASSKLTQHIKGEGTSGVTLLEYGDFQCPYCQQYEETVQKVVEKYGDKIKFQFRHFPIQTAHPNAFAASRAAEAASYQDKFWEMHDKLYEIQNWQAWTNASSPNNLFNQYAKELGLNVDQFKKDFASRKVNDSINADMAEANKVGVTGTPSFFVDGKKVEVTNTTASFEKVLDEAIKKKSSNGSQSSNQQ